ncbi:MAG: polymerase-binding transcription factor DksA [Pseudomonadota bacterium]|jgi:DnaK suppressor protein
MPSKASPKPAAPAAKKLATKVATSGTAVKEAEKSAAKLQAAQTAKPAQAAKPAGAAAVEKKSSPAIAPVLPSAPSENTSGSTSKKNLDSVAIVSEAQLRKMSEDEYMNDVQLAYFRKSLSDMRAQILANASDTGEHLRENEVTTDPADRATQEEEYTLELRTRDRERKLLKKIEKSLLTIDDGSYGWCEETGEPIGIPRLLARPTASLSLEAQERRERMQKLYG